MKPFFLGGVCGLCFFCCSLLFAQQSPQISIEFLVPEFLITANFESERFLEWGKTFHQTLAETFSVNATDRDMILLLTLFPQEDFVAELSSKPAYEKTEREQLIASLKKNPPPRPKRSEISILFSIRLNRGNQDASAEYEPKVNTPLERRKLFYQGLTLLEYRQRLQQWATQEVLPILSECMATWGDDFAGIAAMIQQTQPISWEQSVPLFEWGEKNPSYWIALMEMEPGNHLFPALITFMYIARGELDIASRYLNVLKIFSNPEELATYYLQDLFWKLEQFFLKYHQEIQKGQKLVLEKEWIVAKQQMSRLQEIYPSSPHIVYELYCLQQLQKTSDSVVDSWEETRTRLFSFDPFFKGSVPLLTPRDAFQMARRKEASLLFSDKEELKSDFIEYADIALDLGEYGFAAHLYWFAFTYFSEDPEEQKYILCSFFYCLQQLGHSQLHTLVQGISLEEIQQIPEERVRFMQQHPAYQTFKKKE